MGNYFKLLCFLFLTQHYFLLAQEPILEQHKPGQKWQAKNKGNVTYVFPSAHSQRLKRSFFVLDSLKSSIYSGIDHVPRHIRFIYNNRTMVSNGFVTFFPWRSEIQTPPSQDFSLSGNAPWLNMVSIHEYRHVVQLDAINKGFNKFLYVLFGDQALAGIRTISIPDWFTEGDAVFIETMLTPGGRGRLPSFYQPWLLNLKELGDKYYEKQYLGSYKHNIPNHYVFGYLMSAYLYSNYDYETVGSAMVNSGKNWFFPFSYGLALKKKTGKSLNKNYKEMASYYNSLIPEEKEVDDLVFDNNIKRYTNYDYPKYYKDGILSIRNGIGDISQIVYTKNEKTRKVKTAGLVYQNNQISLADDRLAWVEYLPGRRWQKLTNTQVRILDIESGGTKRIMKREGVTNFLFSQSGDRSLTLHYFHDQGQVLKVHDLLKEEEIFQLKSNVGQQWISPFWVNENRIGFFEQNGKEHVLVIINITNGFRKELIIGNGTPGPAHSYKGYVFFSYPIGSVDHIIAMNRANGEIRQITNEGYGNYFPYIVNGRMIYNSLTAAGRNVAQKNVKNIGEFPVIELNPIKPFGLKGIDKQFSQNNSIKESDNDNETKKKSPGALMPFAWGVEFLNDDLDMSIGLSARDALMRYSLTGGYRISTDLDERGWFSRFSYQALPIILDFEYENLQRSLDRAIEGGNVNFNWNEEIISAGLRLPLNFTSGKYFNNLLMGASFNQAIVENFNQDIRFLDQLSNGTFQFTDVTLRFSHILKTSHRDFLPRWGFQVNAGNRISLDEDDFSASQVYGWGDIFVPGLFKHHSFKIRGSGYWQQLTGESLYIFSNRVPLVRGYSNILFGNYGMFSLEYSLPLWYPDIKIGPFIYFKRFRGSIYYDRGKGVNNENNFILHQESYGGTIKTDLNIMRLRRDMVIGVDINYRPDTKNVSYNLVLNTFVF
ncbi:BamA/TamA family outer membrane protein [Mangrovivirga cuniculi]|uniref:hypothetical protein n=1 Tax=Mangrovivirga cuniculi TaxID=2715131 RepID=UPI0010BF6564|nr:hypothetical protein [Mangrovivirga cuniculi]